MLLYCFCSTILSMLKLKFGTIIVDLKKYMVCFVLAGFIGGIELWLAPRAK